MRFALFLIFGLFLWAGTISIKYPQQPSSSVIASSGHTCTGKSHGDRLLASLKMGTITNIHDNGQILTIGLSPQWKEFPSSVQQKTYDTVVCYAHSQHRPFQFLVSQKM